MNRNYLTRGVFQNSMLAKSGKLEWLDALIEILYSGFAYGGLENSSDITIVHG